MTGFDASAKIAFAMVAIMFSIWTLSFPFTFYHLKTIFTSATSRPRHVPNFQTPLLMLKVFCVPIMLHCKHCINFLVTSNGRMHECALNIRNQNTTNRLLTKEKFGMCSGLLVNSPSAQKRPNSNCMIILILIFQEVRQHSYDTFTSL